MVTPRFYAPALRPEARAIALPEEEALHLTRVLRLGVGASVQVFDGQGLEYRARVVHAERADVRLEVESRVDAAPEPRVRVTLAQAVVKGDKMDDVVRDAVMLGVAAIQPLLTERTDVPGSAFATDTRLDRWRRIAVASIKQCGRAVMPVVSPPMRLDECLRRDGSERRIMLAEPGAADGAMTGEMLRAEGPPASALVLVGPEGGWSPAEVSLARETGCRLVTFGQRTLRADAVPLIALGVLQFLWGDL